MMLIVFGVRIVGHFPRGSVSESLNIDVYLPFDLCQPSECIYYPRRKHSARRTDEKLFFVDDMRINAWAYHSTPKSLTNAPLSYIRSNAFPFKHSH